MSQEKQENLHQIQSAPPPARESAAPPPAARALRRAQENTQLPPSVDTFATPSLPLSATEPPVFGGINPGTPETPAPAPETPAPETAGGIPFSDPLLSLEDSLKAADILANPPEIQLRRIIFSIPFLSIAMLLCLAAAIWMIQTSVTVQASVRGSITFANYEKLDQLAQEDLQTEIGKLLRTYTVRAAAWEILQKRNPDVTPGFLNSGLTFHRLDAVQWEPDGRMVLMVQTSDTAGDVVRLSAMEQAIYNAAQSRNIQLEKDKQSLVDGEKKQLQMGLDDSQIKKQIEDLTPDAQQYIELKLALQSTERYITLADESNPLRFVAKQKLQRLADQVRTTRLASVTRDDLLGKRVVLQRQMGEHRANLARIRRSIDYFSYPLPPDPKAMVLVDTRPHRRMVMTNVCLVIVAIFGSAIAAVHFYENRRKSEEFRIRRKPASGGDVDGVQPSPQ